VLSAVYSPRVISPREAEFYSFMLSIGTRINKNPKFVSWDTGDVCLSMDLVAYKQSFIMGASFSYYIYIYNYKVTFKTPVLVFGSSIGKKLDLKAGSKSVLSNLKLLMFPRWL
jgi:hypothetical protein